MPRWMHAPLSLTNSELEMSLNLKHELVTTVGMAIKAFMGRNSITHETTWEEIVQFFPLGARPRRR